MSRANKSKHAVLALLSIGPRSGYDVERDVRSLIGHFWQESFGQIYPTLRKIVAEGLATVHEEKRDGKPIRKVYTITAEGRAAVKQWLATPPDPPPVRNEMLLKLFVGWQTSPEVHAAHVSGLLEHFTRELAQFDVFEKIIEQLIEQSPDALYWAMTLRSGQLYVEARRQWCEETLALLARVEANHPGSKRTTAARTKTMSRLLKEAHAAIQAVQEQARKEESTS